MCPNANQLEPRRESPRDFFKNHIPRKPAVNREDPKAFLRRVSRAQQEQQAAAVQQGPGAVPEH